MERRTREHQLKVARYKMHREVKKFAGPEPLSLHAIGDSWFEYPLDGNIPMTRVTPSRTRCRFEIAPY
jgi:hypothetical protein